MNDSLGLSAVSSRLSPKLWREINLRCIASFISLVATLLLAFAGCATQPAHTFGAKAAVPAMARVGSVQQDNFTEARSDRMLRWNAQLELQVINIDDTINKVTAVVAQDGGYIEAKSESTEESAHLRLRVPSTKFRSTIGGLEKLGKVKSRSVSGEDVTEQYVDLEARLKNKIALRDRLKQLVDKATAVKDILAIETELNRDPERYRFHGRKDEMAKRPGRYGYYRSGLEEKTGIGTSGIRV